ncbi:MAG: cyclic nucleotide-binding domain-containing protein [Pseudomonadota bacterium]
MSVAPENLDPGTREVVERCETTRNAAEGDLFVAEGDQPDELFRIVSGKAAVVRASADGTDHTIATLGPGELVGELAFVDGAPRSASVRAITPVTLECLSARTLAAMPDGQSALAELKAALGASIVRRMRAQNDRYVGALQRQVAILQERRHFGLFYIYTVAAMGFGTLVDAFITRRLFEVDVYSVTFSWQYLLALMIPTGIVAWKMKILPRDLGITTKGLRRSLVEGVIISVILIALLVVGARAASGVFGVTLNPIQSGPVGIALYAVHSFLQELFARGFVQTSFQRFLDDRRGIISVLLAAFMFALFHLHYGLFSVAVVGIGGLIFGFIYLRHRNLAGVTLVHLTTGVAAFSVGLI